MQSERGEIHHLTANCQYPMNNIAGTHIISSSVSLTAKVKLTPLMHEGNFSRKHCTLLPHFTPASQVINIIFKSIIHINTFRDQKRRAKLAANLNMQLCLSWGINWTTLLSLMVSQLKKDWSHVNAFLKEIQINTTSWALQRISKGNNPQCILRISYNCSIQVSGTISLALQTYLTLSTTTMTKCSVYTRISRGLPMNTIFPLRITKLLYTGPGLLSQSNTT